MNQQQAIEEIGKALGVLAYQVEQGNLSGMFSKNSLIEDLLRTAAAFDQGIQAQRRQTQSLTKCDSPATRVLRKGVKISLDKFARYSFTLGLYRTDL